VAQKFEAACRIDPRDDVAARAKILRLAEEAKQTLTARAKTVVHVHHAGRSVEVPVPRRQFEALTADLLERTAHTTTEVLREARLTWNQIDRLLLVGGATRMPMVSRRLYELSGMTAEQSINPDEAVARGAAIYAAYRLSREGQGEFLLRLHIVDVNAHSLGVEGINLTTGRRENSILIPRNTPLPTQVTHQFVTKKAQQQSIVLKVLEGEHTDPDACIPIGRAVLRDLPPGLPQGHPLDVTYAYAANGRLTVHLQVAETEKQLTLKLQRGDSLSEDHVDRWTHVVSSEDGFRSFEEMLEAILGVQATERNRGRTADSNPGNFDPS
jgi:molecular chaperone DnaK